mgnify:CR=1 FL=1
MGDSSLFDIVEVKETEETSELNGLLSNGWKLLATYSYAPYIGEPENRRLVYSIGRPSSVAPAKAPDPFIE